MELTKFEEKQVAVISALQKTSNDLKLKAESIDVSDDESLKMANQLVKEINAHKKSVQETRMELTRPLTNVVNQLIAKEKEVLLPLDEGKTEVGGKILDYTAEVERKRLEEQRRVEEITDRMADVYDMRVTQVDTVDAIGASLKEYFGSLSDADQNNPTIKVAFMTTVGKLSDQKAKIEEEARAEAERVRQAEEQKRLDEAAKTQSEEQARIAKERKAIEDEKKRIEDEKAQMARDKEELERQKEIQKAEAEAAKLSKATGKGSIKTNQVTTTKFEIIDEDAVGRIYCSPDEKKIREAIKLGATEIAGVRIFNETKVR